MSGRDKTGILLLAHGSPESAADVPEFMRNITSGRAIPQEALDEVSHRYGLIGRSPLTDITMAQAAALSRQLDLPVYVGMRNWKPYITTAVKEMVSDGITRALAICLAPQNSRTSVGLYRRAAFAEAGTELKIEFIDAWHDHPLLIKAFAEQLRTAWDAACREAGATLPVIFTAHSVPCRTIQAGDPYGSQTKETATLVAQQVAGMIDWSFAFQSQGMSGGTWIGPTVEATILAYKAEGHHGVLIDPVGFVCDHVEVLYDIDISFQQFAAQHGMKLWRTQSLNTSPVFIDALADLARSRMEQLAMSAS